MVCALLLSKAPEEQFVKRIEQGLDQGELREMFEPALRRNTNVKIAICQDGRHWELEKYAWKFKLYLEALFRFWRYKNHFVDTYDFSFEHGDVNDMFRLLVDVDVFIMGGVHNVSQRWKERTSQGQEAWPLVKELQARVQYNVLMYIGICGGAILSGKDNPYGLEPFDLFQGMRVRYDWKVNAKNVEQHQERAQIQITSGTGVAIHCWRQQRRGLVFSTVKNHRSWKRFAEDSSTRLTHAIECRANNPASFHFGRGQWWYSLAGFAYSRVPGVLSQTSVWVPEPREHRPRSIALSGFEWHCQTKQAPVSHSFYNSE